MTDLDAEFSAHLPYLFAVCLLAAAVVYLYA
jgi:hypothetical protein